MPKTDSHLFKSDIIAKKFYGKLPIAHAWAYYFFHKESKIQQLLHSLKYDNKPEIAQELGSRYGAEIKKSIEKIPFDVIVPVPLHFKKQKLRGYNQSEVFARGLEEQWAIPVNAYTLVRAVATETQTKKTRMQRWMNVEEIFLVKGTDLVGRHVLLVDDVITTGATIEACAKALLDAGAAEVSIMAIAVAK